MTDPNWNPTDYFQSFPDISHNGSLVTLPIHGKLLQVTKYLHDHIFTQAIKSLQVDADLAALILGLITVDYVAGFYVGKSTQKSDYIGFINRYFPNKYHPFAEAIYGQLRCGLLHNLVMVQPWQPNTTSFKIVAESQDHLITDSSGRVTFSIFTFLEDTRRAWIIFAHDVGMKGTNYPDLVRSFERRFNRLGGEAAFMMKTTE